MSTFGGLENSQFCGHMTWKIHRRTWYTARPLSKWCLASRRYCCTASSPRDSEYQKDTVPHWNHKINLSSINQSINQSINLPINQSNSIQINQSINQFVVYQSINQSINQSSIHQSSIHSFIQSINHYWLNILIHNQKMIIEFHKYLPFLILVAFRNWRKSVDFYCTAKG